MAKSQPEKLVEKEMMCATSKWFVLVMFCFLLEALLVLVDMKLIEVN